MPKEITLQDFIIKYLKGRKVWHFRYTANITYGMPDIIAIYKGYFVGIEVKVEDGSGISTELQESMRKSIIKAGGYAIITDNLNDVINLFLEIDANST
jgi:Holliday junction resolvase